MSIERIGNRKFKIEKIDTDKIRETEKQINDELLGLYKEGHMSYKDTISELLEQQNKIMEKLAIPLNEGETSKGHENDITRFMDFYFRN